MRLLASSLQGCGRSMADSFRDKARLQFSINNFGCVEDGDTDIFFYIFLPLQCLQPLQIAFHTAKSLTWPREKKMQSSLVLSLASVSCICHIRKLLPNYLGEIFPAEGLHDCSHLWTLAEISINHSAFSFWRCSKVGMLPNFA